MVVLGNPPYSVSSTNKGEWINELMKDYKKDLNDNPLSLTNTKIKVLRGGSFDFVQTASRCAFRFHEDEEHFDNNIGFRVAINKQKEEK